MKPLLLTVLGGGVLALTYWLTRCRHTHIIRHRRRDEDGQPVPYVLEWQCFHCHQIMGFTVAAPHRANVTDIRARRAVLKQAVHSDIRRRA